MKFNKTTFKVLFAFLLIIAALVWSVDSIRTQVYSGNDLNFVVGHGTVTVTNPSNQAVPAQLLATGSRSFTVSSPIEGMPTSSTKLGTGRDTTQTVDFELAPGVSEFSVARGSSTTPDVTFVASSASRLEAKTQALNASESNTILIAAAVVILIALLTISSVTGHRWINVIRGKNASIEDTQPHLAIVDGGQGEAQHSYGDNRVSIAP